MKVPVELVARTTLPLGVVGVVKWSVTVAVHELAALTVTEPGEQESNVVVVCGGGGVTGIVNVPWLAECVESPPYEPVMR